MGKFLSIIDAGLKVTCLYIFHKFLNLIAISTYSSHLKVLHDKILIMPISVIKLWVYIKVIAVLSGFNPLCIVHMVTIILKLLASAKRFLQHEKNQQVSKQHEHYRDSRC